MYPLCLATKYIMTDESAGKSDEHTHMTAFAPFEAEKSSKLLYKEDRSGYGNDKAQQQAQKEILIQSTSSKSTGSTRVFFKRSGSSVPSKDQLQQPSMASERGGRPPTKRKVSPKPPAKQTLPSKRPSPSQPSTKPQAQIMSGSYNTPSFLSESCVVGPSSQSVDPKGVGPQASTRHTHKDQLSISVSLGGRQPGHVDNTQDNIWGADPQISLLSYSDVRKGHVHSRAGVPKVVTPQQPPPSTRQPVNRFDVVRRIGIIEKHQVNIYVVCF